MSNSKFEIVEKIFQNNPNCIISLGKINNGDKFWDVYSLDKKVTNDEVIFNYEIGSLTKVFTAFNFINLIKRKKVNGETKIDEIISELPSEKNFPSCTELLEHRSGYGFLTPLTLCDLVKIASHGGVYQYNPYSENMCASNVLTYLIENKVPKRKHIYSNFGYAILGYIISQLEGRNYEEVIVSFLKYNLGLLATTFNDENLLVGYHKWKNMGNWSWSNCDNNVGKAAGALRSNIQDLLKFSSKIVDDPYLQERPDCIKSLGMIRRERNIWFKVGQTGTHFSVMAIDFDNKTSSVVLMNCLARYGVPLAFELLKS